MKNLSRFMLILLSFALTFNLLDIAPNVALAHNTAVSKLPSRDTYVPNRTAQQQDTTPKEVVFTPDGGWLILYGTNGYSASTENVPSELTDQLDQYQTDKQEIKWVAFTPDGNWIIFFGLNGYYGTKGLPQAFVDKLSALNDAGHEFGEVSFNPDGEWVILYDTNHYAASKKIPTDLTDKLDELINGLRTLKHVTFTSDGKWLVLYNENRYAAQAGFDKNVTDVLKEVNQKGWLLDQVAFMKVASSSDASSGTPPATSAGDSSTAAMPDLFVVLYGGGVVWSKTGLPDTLTQRLTELVTGS